MSIKETLSNTEQVPVYNVTGKRRFAMIDEKVLSRRDLTAYDKIVLAVMHMESYGSGGVAISHQVIARKGGMSRSQVIFSIRRLENAGLISRNGATVKQVQPYRLPAAAKIQHQGTDRTTSSRPAITCPKCSMRCRGLLRVGWCRACNWKLKIRRVVVEEIARIA